METQISERKCVDSADTAKKRELSPERKIRAKKRWKFLISVLNNKKTNVLDSISVRRFASFGLLETAKLDYDKEMMVNSLTDRQFERRHYWYQYTCPAYPQYKVHIRHLDGTLDIGDVLGFNNTGNVCVWPSEEILTNYCLQNLNIFKNQSVCELGGGMSSLAGVAVGQCSEASRVHLTDGNQTSVNNIDIILERNRGLFGDTNVTAGLLRWNECPEDLHQQFDIVICADCMFFDEYRQDLIEVLDKLLKPGGKIVMFAPMRNQTFLTFLSLVNSRFTSVVTREKYDDTIWSLHQQYISAGNKSYEPDLHYPWMLTCSKHTGS